jgi:predicted RNA-binding protein Jag
MKSILQEAPSVVKAVEKAWALAGNPQEFTVKVLESGKKNFLGITRKPAIISLIYDPKTVPEKPVVEAKKPQAPQRKGRKPEVRAEGTREQRKKMQAPAKTRQVSRSQQDLQERERVELKLDLSAGWTSELSKDIESWIRTALKTMNITTPMSVTIDNRLLRFHFDGTVLEGIDEERMLFASFAYLFLQGLKKKYKNKFKGFHIVLTSEQQLAEKKEEQS